MDVLVAHPDPCWQCGLSRAENWVCLWSSQLWLEGSIPGWPTSNNWSVHEDRDPAHGLSWEQLERTIAAPGFLWDQWRSHGACVTVSSPSAQFCCPDRCVGSFGGHTPMLVSKGCHDKVPHMGWLTATVTYSLSVLDLEGPCSFWRLQGRLSLWAFLLGSGVDIDPWHSGLQMCHLGLCVDCHVASHHLPSVYACLCVSFPFFWIRTRPNDLILTWLYLQRPFFQIGHLHRYRGLGLQHIS